ncbi:MAG: virulence factor SrfB [Saprospiraceae bacterium]|nr:virulence factor SrfB [Candidatus Vicinibacter affinis]
MQRYFRTNPPTQAVLTHFKDNFRFDLSDIQWTYKKKIIADIVEKTFDSLIGKISALLSYYDCDIVLLSGRPSSLKPISDLFLKYYAISPNRLKSMNDYRVGRWYPHDRRYPFIDGNGKFTNPKSIVTTGAMIGHIAQNGTLNGFGLDLTELKKKLLPTTYFFGKLNDDSLKYLNTIISPDHNQATVDVSALPFRLGVRQIDVSAYPSRPFIHLILMITILKTVFWVDLKKTNHLQIWCIRKLKKKRIKFLRGFPLKVKISRDRNVDIEKLILDEVSDRDGNSLPKNFFIMQVQSMSEIENFWLDSGIFSLNLHI